MTLPRDKQNQLNPRRKCLRETYLSFFNTFVFRRTHRIPFQKRSQAGCSKRARLAHNRWTEGDKLLFEGIKSNRRESGRRVSDVRANDPGVHTSSRTNKTSGILRTGCYFAKTKDLSFRLVAGMASNNVKNLDGVRTKTNIDAIRNDTDRKTVAKLAETLS